METKEKLDELMTRAVEAELDGVELFAQFSIDDIQREYNGIGPEWMPAEIRDRLSGHLELFAPAALIHDLRYSRSNGSRFDFNFANMEFGGNCVKLANDAHPWYSWRRYAARAAAQVAFDCVRSQAGWIAWCEASRKSFNRE